ncbi:hypothetical protein [Streptomyces sp. NPDC001880]
MRWFTGPLATTWIGHQGLGRAATIAVSATVYAILPHPAGGTPSDGSEPDKVAPLHF